MAAASVGISHSRDANRAIGSLIYRVLFVSPRHFLCLGLEARKLLVWLIGGCDTFAPPTFKRLIVLAYIHRFRIRTFIESGTYRGDTLAVIAKDKGVSCWSIELDAELYEKARVRFRLYENVRLLQGDSGVLLTAASGAGPTLYWLDGHYSGPGTALGVIESPIVRELEVILQMQTTATVVLIDDARCFNGAGGYPHLDELLKMIRGSGRFNVSVSADVVRCVSKDLLVDVASADF